MKMKVRVIKTQNQFIRFESDSYNGELLDTSVFINGYLFACIAGQEIDNFIKDYEQLILKYKI
jgi:hypothetical protein